jgi:uncharacterized membrane protein
MIDTVGNYVPVDAVQKLKVQAARAWMLAVALTALWVLLIVLAPIAESAGSGSVSSPLYKFFGYICHQLPERSFHLDAHKFAVCSRCFGVYFGLLVGFVIYPLWRRLDDIEPLSRFWLILSLIPIGIDWSLGIFGIWENTHLSRFVTGLILGTACSTFIMPAVVEIVRNSYLNRRLRKAA